MRRPITSAAWTGLAAVAHTAISYFSFYQPADLADGQACGLVAGDFATDGHRLHAPLYAWWISFERKQAYWTALTVGLTFEFGRRKARAA
jgi:hypothetical protein